MPICVRNLVAATFLCLFAAGSATAKDIVDTAVDAGQFKTLVAAVQAADLADTLRVEGPFTVFAPTDAAFANLPKGTVESLLEPENKGALASILTYHVVPGRVAAKDVFGLSSADTVNGQRLAISRESGRLTVAGAKVVTTDIKCDNGIIHVIDAVMLPTDKTIPEVATEAGTFNTLLAAAGAADLAEVLGSDGPFTVFAPTDEAFAKLPEGTVKTLLKPENKGKLASVLKYHVIAGRVYAGQAVEAGKAKTLQGQAVQIQFSADGLKIDNAKVVAADIAAANGVVHVIDTVMLPKTIDTRQAMTLLEDAVEKGSHLYNRGHVHACTEMYAKACREIVDTGDNLPANVMPVLTATLQRANTTHGVDDRAWVLRNGIDLAYFALQQ